MAMSSRNVAIGLVSAVVFVIIAFLLVSRTGVSGDKKVYMEFYHEINAKMKAIDDSFKPFGDAMDNRQWAEAVRHAKSDMANISRNLAELESQKIPDLTNDLVEKKLLEAKGVLSEAYQNKVSVITNFLAFAKDPSLAKEMDEEINKNISAFNNKYKQGLEQLLVSGQELGVDMEKLFQEKK